MEELINNIMNTPENTNPNVLRGQLETIGNNSNGGIFVVEDNDGTLNKTFQEIYDALDNDQFVMVKATYPIEENIPAYALNYVESAGPSSDLGHDGYIIHISGIPESPYYADTMDDYPSSGETEVFR